jgi:hypothetical protein
MSRHFWIPLGVAIVVPWVARAAGDVNGFDGVVGTIESRYHARATRVPLLGLASMIARGATHDGVRNVHVAEFEHFSAPVDGDELNRLVAARLGQGWERVIRETSRKGGEQTLIFARPEDKLMGVFIVDLDQQEMNVVEVSVDPDHLMETVNKYTHNDRGQDEPE